MASKKAKAKKLKYTLRNDVLFKMLFVKNRHLLKRLVSELLTIPYASIQHFQGGAAGCNLI